MGRGGARNRSGPQKDPSSGRSDRADFRLTPLPNEGYQGEAPDFPLMPFTVKRWEQEDKRRYQVVDDEATEAFREREVVLWEKAWTYPQAAAWALEPWRWNTVAMWVRTQVVCESSEATAADKGAIHRFADQIGMTPAGLKENGWSVAPVEVGSGARADEPVEDEDDPRNRLTVVNGGGA